MKIGRKVTAAMVGVLAAPLIVVALPSGTALAHGYINSPASRQAQCASGVVKDCGAIQWEPQSVEGPKGLQSCHANLSQFSVLSNDNKGWKVTNTGRSVTFNWTFTARHRTRDYDYFVDGRKVATFSGNNQQPLLPPCRTPSTSARPAATRSWPCGTSVTPRWRSTPASTSTRADH